MKILLLFPVLLYLALMLVNAPLLQSSQFINLFWAVSIEAPLFLFSSAFVVIYALSIYLAYSGIRGYQLHKIKKLERELVEIKSQLFDHQKELLEKMHGDFEVQFENFKRDNEQKFDTIIKFNQYTLEKVLEETNGSFDKYKKETQKLLRQAKGVDSKLVEKLMFWR